MPEILRMCSEGGAVGELSVLPDEEWPKWAVGWLDVEPPNRGPPHTNMLAQLDLTLHTAGPTQTEQMCPEAPLARQTCPCQGQSGQP